MNRHPLFIDLASFPSETCLPQIQQKRAVGNFWTVNILALLPKHFSQNWDFLQNSTSNPKWGVKSKFLDDCLLSNSKAPIVPTVSAR
jgi:hypothetical protein